VVFTVNEEGTLLEDFAQPSGISRALLVVVRIAFDPALTIPDQPVDEFGQRFRCGTSGFGGAKDFSRTAK